jgi:hypothetical protein
MQTQVIKFDPDEARSLWRAYQKHKHYSSPVDQEIAAIYKKIAEGRTVIRAIASIIAAGLHTSGPYLNLPKLAICRADLPRVHWRPRLHGGEFLTSTRRRQNEHHSRSVSIANGTWRSVSTTLPSGIALTPIVPLNVRPKRGLENYHVLWEAEWQPVPPGDPYLLRRIGRSDAWLVVAAWHLTEIERAVLATRMNG